MTNAPCEHGSELPRVLIAEDDPFSRGLLELYLEQAGYPFISAKNGKEALEIYSRDFFPILITDWLMPEMDGTELCRAIRAIESERYTYLILLTSKSSQESVVDGLEAGADDYMIKPIHPAELRVRLNGARRIFDLEASLRKSLSEIRELSIRDPLTGAFNRGYMDSQLQNEIRRAYRYEHPLSVIICDLDHFKQVNDTFGHQAGDIALRQCVADISVSIRQEIDWVARYGGEEFVIVLPVTDASGCLVVAERIRMRICSHPVSTPMGDINLTASFGAVTFSPADAGASVTVDMILQQADTCLYRAKNEGRNRVVANFTPLQQKG